MRIDSHQHFWVYQSAEYPWIGANMATLARDRMPQHLEPLLKKMRMDGTIAVQARQSVDETKFLLSLAMKFDFIRGVVGWVDLCSPDLGGQLEQLMSPLLRGLRHVVQDESDPDFLLRPDFLRGIKMLPEFGLVYDLLIRPHQLPAAEKLVALFPQQIFVLDHLAKPLIQSGTLEPWRSEIGRLAALDNVVCKISGMVTEAGGNWKPQQFEPYLEVVLDAFGPRRLMIGSDWPVCTLAGSYETVIGIVEDYIARLSYDEGQEVWGRTAARVYNV